MYEVSAEKEKFRSHQWHWISAISHGRDIMWDMLWELDFLEDNGEKNVNNSLSMGKAKNYEDYLREFNEQKADRWMWSGSAA